MYQERTYREWIEPEGLVRTAVSVGESDLLILARSDLAAPAGQLTREVRERIEEYIDRDPGFASALAPYRPFEDAPAIIRRMADAGSKYGVGPMAAVAGAVAEYVGDALSGECDEVIIENGGDVYMKSHRPVTMSLYAGEPSPFTGKVKFRVSPKGRALGVCTSSGVVGHSTSFGCADAVTIICDSALEADAAATAFCNAVRGVADVDAAIKRAEAVESVKGIIVAIEDRLGMWGEVEFV